MTTQMQDFWQGLLAAPANAYQGLAGQLHALGAGIGADTPLGNWLMQDAAGVLAVCGGVLLLLGAWQVQRGRRDTSAELATDHGAGSGISSTGFASTDATAAGSAPAQDRVHPEALAMLYDNAMRREPVLTDRPEVTAPAPIPERMATVTSEVRLPASEPAAQPADMATGQLALAAVDRLLQRVDSQQAQIHALLDELKAQSAALLMQGERLLQLEARLEQATAGPADSADEERLQSFDQAIVLAGQGLDEEALMARCGISAAEARLINLVHGQSAAAAPDAEVASR